MPSLGSTKLNSTTVKPKRQLVWVDLVRLLTPLSGCAIQHHTHTDLQQSDLSQQSYQCYEIFLERSCTDIYLVLHIYLFPKNVLNLNGQFFKKFTFRAFPSTLTGTRQNGKIFLLYKTKAINVKPRSNTIPLVPQDAAQHIKQALVWFNKNL